MYLCIKKGYNFWKRKLCVWVCFPASSKYCFGALGLRADGANSFMYNISGSEKSMLWLSNTLILIIIPISPSFLLQLSPTFLHFQLLISLIVLFRLNQNSIQEEINEGLKLEIHVIIQSHPPEKKIHQPQ